MSGGVKAKTALRLVQDLLDKGELNEAKKLIDGCNFAKVENEEEAKIISELWQLRDLVNARWLKEGKREEEEDDINKFIYFKKNKWHVDIDSVAEHIENSLSIRTIFGIKEETIEVYQDGIWVVKGRGIIKSMIERLLGQYCKNNVVSEVLEKIKRRSETSREETEIVPNKKRCLRNGVLDFENIDDIKLLPHSKEYNFRTKWDIEYKPEAKCPKYLEVVNNALGEKHLIDNFQEWNGLHLRRDYPFKKFAIFFGPKDTSKTLLMNHLTIALNNNVVGLSLQDIGRGKGFDLLDLKDKDANQRDDLSSTDMSSTGGIKMSVGDGFIQGEMKFGDKVRFRNTAKHTFSCNEIPSPRKDINDDAYYGRILLFLFQNIIPKEEQDEELIYKITTQEELSGWLNWAIEGYKRLIKQNGFSNEKSPDEIKFLMIKGGTSLGEFALEVLEESAGDKISKDDLYNIYCLWCMDHKPKLSPDSKDRIGKSLARFIPYTQSSKSGSERYWLNIKVRDTWDTLQKTIRNIQEIENKEKDTSQNKLYNFSKGVPDASNFTEELNEEVPFPDA